MKRFMGIIAFLCVFSGYTAIAEDDCRCCQRFTYRFGGGEETTVIKWDDLDVVPIEEIYKVILYLNAIEGTIGAKELKLEIFKRLAPNLYERNIKHRE